MKHYNFLVTAIIILLSSCVSQKQVVRVYADFYDKETDKTTVAMIPYKDIIIPGKWTIKEIIPSSKQVILTNNDSSTIAIAQNHKKGFPFYTDSITDSDLLNSYYEWETNHWISGGYNYNKILENSDEGYVICKFITDSFDNLFLFGVKNDMLVNYLIVTKWEENKEVEFLENLFGINK